MNDPFTPVERIAIDTSEQSVYARVQQTAVLAADAWGIDHNPRDSFQMTMAQYARGLINEGLLHLLELGIVTVDVDRLNYLLENGCPVQREGR